MLLVSVRNPHSPLIAGWIEAAQLWQSLKDLMRASQVALVIKNPPANARDKRDVGSMPRSGRSPGGGHGNQLQYSYLENSMDRGAWHAIVHRVTKNQTQLKRLSTHSQRAWLNINSSLFSKMHLFIQSSKGNLPNLSSSSSINKDDHNNTYLIWLLWRFNGLTHINACNNWNIFTFVGLLFSLL